MKQALALLHDGRVVLVFPEGYPNIDPGYTPKSGEDDFLPFQPGVARLVTMASMGGEPVPVIPVGFHYRRGPKWEVTMRFGPPLTIPDRAREPAALLELETQVRALSISPIPE
jgi:1-acyl-sn-glycerol-3-phosphate acyltransferase